MGLNHQPLLRIQLPRLQEDPVGDADLPHVVGGRGVADDLHGLVGKLHPARYHLGKPPDALHVVGSVPVLVLARNAVQAEAEAMLRAITLHMEAVLAGSALPNELMDRYRSIVHESIANLRV